LVKAPYRGLLTASHSTEQVYRRNRRRRRRRRR